MRSCVRLARSAKSSASAVRLSSWVSSLLLAAAGFTAVASGRRRGRRPCRSSPPCRRRRRRRSPRHPSHRRRERRRSAERNAWPGYGGGSGGRAAAAVREPRARRRTGGVRGGLFLAVEERGLGGQFARRRSDSASARAGSSYVRSSVRARSARRSRSPAGRTRARLLVVLADGGGAVGPPSEFHCVASYAPVSKVCVPHSHCWVWSAGPACSGWSQVLASHWPLASPPVGLRGMRRVAGSRPPRRWCRTPPVS